MCLKIEFLIQFMACDVMVHICSLSVACCEWKADKRGRTQTACVPLQSSKKHTLSHIKSKYGVVTSAVATTTGWRRGPGGVMTTSNMQEDEEGWGRIRIRAVQFIKKTQKTTIRFYFLETNTHGEMNSPHYCFILYRMWRIYVMRIISWTKIALRVESFHEITSPWKIAPHAGMCTCARTHASTHASQEQANKETSRWTQSLYTRDRCQNIKIIK